MIHRDSASVSGKDDSAGGLTLGRPRLALIWLAAVVLTSLVPLANWLAGHVSR
jgi:hypothetical protein